MLVTYVGQNPRAYQTDENFKPGFGCIRFHGLSEPDPLLSVLIGEAAYNLRSALDHLMYAMVIAEGGVPHGQTAFPICRTRTAWHDGKNKKRIKGLKPFGRRLQALHRLQPYRNRPANKHPLVLLDAIMNADKHRHLVVAKLTQEPTGRFFGDGPVFVPTGFRRDLKPGDVLTVYPLPTPEVIATNKFNVEAKVGLVFDAPGIIRGKPVRSTFARIIRHIEVDVLGLEVLRNGLP